MSNYALRFISGKYQGGEFPLRMDREILIGRSSDLDMVLVEDMVSRKHAKITTTNGDIIIQDLGSTNGTFVNGEKVKTSRLKEGDRILVGTSIIKMVAVGASANANDEAQARANLQSTSARPVSTATSSGRPMSGAIEEIPLPDLLQLFSTSRKDGVLSIRSSIGLGKIYLRQGQIYYSSIDDNFALHPRKALYRLLTWRTGTFELGPPEDRQVIEEIDDSTERLLMDGLRQLDEVRRIESSLPPPGSMLAVPTPLAGRLRDLAPEELDVFQLVLDHGRLEPVVDNYQGSDLDCYLNLANLMRADFVVRT